MLISPKSRAKNGHALFSLLYYQTPPYDYIQKHGYVDVYMKWKKDRFFDSIESIHKSIELKPLIALKNYIVSSAPEDYCIPISAVSKKGLQLDIPIKVASFLRKYPSVFEEFTGPKYNIPWFRLTQKAIELDKEEREVYNTCKLDLVERLRKLIFMSVGEKKVLPVKIIQGMKWNLGLPDDFLRDPERISEGCFRIVEMEEGIKGLAVESDRNSERIFSVMEKNAMRAGLYSGGEMEAIAFPLFPSKGLRLKTKISKWLDEFQGLPYVSPYADFSGLNPCSDLAEKRLIAVLHELLSLFVEHSAERKRFLCLRKYLGLPQKVHKAFERHPHIFYLSLRNKTCTSILKEAYCNKSAIGGHPLAKVRKKYINLMEQSRSILISKKLNNRVVNHESNTNIKDLDCIDDETSELAESSV